MYSKKRELNIELFKKFKKELTHNKSNLIEENLP